MSLQHELGYPGPIRSRPHEAVLNMLVTGEMLAKEGDALLRGFGLTLAQFNVLMLLTHQAPPEGVTQVTLGRMLLVHRSNITGLIDRMTKAGWVERVKDPADRRAYHVRLTRAGRRLAARVEGPYIDRVEAVMAGLEPDEIQRLCDLLGRVRARLRGNGHP
jgi:DNA-binding MarR family transcriptional regulator